MNKSKSGPETEQKYAQENQCPMQLFPFRGMLFLKGMKYFIAQSQIQKAQVGSGEGKKENHPLSPHPLHGSAAPWKAALVLAVRREKEEPGEPRVTLPCCPSCTEATAGGSGHFLQRGCAGAAPRLFATTFLMRLTTHDKLSYMETKSRFDGIHVPQRCKPEVNVQTKQRSVGFGFCFCFSF